MRFSLLLLPALFLAACDPPPARPSRAVIEIYMHPNGLSRCVDSDGERWKADASCCPEGFELAGFSAPAVTEYIPVSGDDEKENDPKRRIYRHVVCLQR